MPLDRDKPSTVSPVLERVSTAARRVGRGLASDDRKHQLLVDDRQRARFGRKTSAVHIGFPDKQNPFQCRAASGTKHIACSLAGVYPCLLRVFNR